MIETAKPSFDALTRAAHSAAVGDAFPGFAHEANNALLAILGLTELTLRDAEPGTRTHERLTLVRESALELSETVRALHAFARMPDEHRAVALDALVRETVALSRRTTAARALELEEDYADADLRVLGSARKLGQVVLALLTAARTSLPEGGTVAVSVERAGDRVVLAVDAGPDADDARSDELDLYVARRVAEEHGGSLATEGGALILTLPVPERA